MSSLIDQLLEARTDAYRYAELYLDGETWAKTIELRDRISDARKEDRGLRSEVPALEKELAGLAEVLEESKVRMRFTAIPDVEYQALLDAHQSDDETLRWDPETFPEALVAVAFSWLEMPDGKKQTGITVEEVEKLRKGLPHQEWELLFATAFQLQMERPKPFTYAATGPTSVSGPSLTTATSEESPTPGS